ncbi:uncharacterized protein LOC105426800 [Pogonomyrmex barbatus]|uniref:Uncharacterized protein LOC105426800 n=1 Tax=Pogonomyrmex barbatus TaxID=144034 RepID=A0A6I9W4Y9_9HYME|nr:uncharacterized protein LOC105426800 [Pogonomyrmex barbatus]XP_025073972.1 uncharacterized protein LOC105426800 [Pogonomyrmex barbatus]XP_025073973.1 uncharacterized protein LOC105426800 [Pogonomyrmex barbatus]XP_025073974.1 uncharacterized protein LOC105426800 [Pogonomyrmex barbatus]
MRTRINLARSFCCLLVATFIGVITTNAKPEPMASLTRSEETDSDIQLKRYADLIRNYHYTFGKPRLGKRGDAAPMTESNAAWEILKMIQDAQRQNEQQRQENIRQNKEQILFRDFPSSDADERMSHIAGFLPDVIGKYYDDVQ